MPRRCGASRRWRRRRALRGRNLDTTAPAAMPPHRKDDGRCCTASSPVQRAANGQSRLSMLTRPDKLFQTPFDARELFAGAEAPAPFRPFLHALLLLARAGLLLFYARLVLVVERSL